VTTESRVAIDPQDLAVLRFTGGRILYRVLGDEHAATLGGQA